ncbi:hypothetical protein DFJ74DRAFT_723945 [Hyaloraphidium curvatum]|nr:hypothetical protein DFJ74DRAFT_723945 [Hyaloraphidium curvatum]
MQQNRPRRGAVPNVPAPAMKEFALIFHVLNGTMGRPRVFRDVALAPALPDGARALEAFCRSRGNELGSRHATKCHACRKAPPERVVSTVALSTTPVSVIVALACGAAACEAKTQKRLAAMEGKGRHPVKVIARIATSWPQDAPNPVFTNAELPREVSLPAAMVSKDKRLDVIKALEMEAKEMMRRGKAELGPRPPCINCGAPSGPYQYDDSIASNVWPWEVTYSVFLCCDPCFWPLWKRISRWIKQNAPSSTTGVWCSACGASSPQREGFKRCSRCKLAHYCSKACQIKDWPGHKKNCNPGLLRKT